MKITIRTKESSFDFECGSEERILYAGLRAGIPLPYECATGTCGTCKARTRSDCVEHLWPQAPGHAYLKPERGEFLMCQARSRGDCEILVPGRPVDGPATSVLPGEHRGIVSGVQMLTHDVAHMEVELDDGVSFEAGQFMVVEAPGVSGFRAYSIVNYDQQATRLEFVIKKKPGGSFSEWLFGNSVQNTQLSMFGPLGRATFHPDEDKDLLFIAGGSGIAGMMSMLERACREGYFGRHMGQVFFGVRTLRDTFFREELSEFCAQASGKLQVTIALSDENAPDGTSTEHPGLSYATGLVHQVAGKWVSGSLGNATTAFVAGPPPMVDGALRMLILEGRLPANDIRYDKFS